MTESNGYFAQADGSARRLAWASRLLALLLGLIVAFAVSLLFLGLAFLSVALGWSHWHGIAGIVAVCSGLSISALVVASHCWLLASLPFVAGNARMARASGIVGLVLAVGDLFVFPAAWRAFNG